MFTLLIAFVALTYVVLYHVARKIGREEVREAYYFRRQRTLDYLSGRTDKLPPLDG